MCSSCVPKIDSVYYRYKLRFPYLEWHIMLLPSRQTKRKLFLGSWSFCVPICVDSSIVSAQPWYQKWLQSILVHTCAYSPEWKLSVLVSDLYGRGRVPTIFITMILSYTGKRHIFNVKYGYYGYINFLLHANVACACKSKNFCRKKVQKVIVPRMKKKCNYSYEVLIFFLHKPQGLLTNFLLSYYFLTTPILL